jgi:putative heme-binding domain-containing protein
MESLAFIGNKEAVNAIISLANSPGEIGHHATWWLLNRGNDDWAKFGTKATLKTMGIYDPETINITPITVPEPPQTKLPSPKEIIQLSGSIESGKIQSTRCSMCHKIGDQGIDYGPNLQNWVSNQGLEPFYEAVIYPSRSIAHGFQGSTIFLKDGGQIQGLLYSELDPVSIMSTGGVQQMVPRSRIKNIRRRNKTSLMLSADQLGLSAQDLADLGAYMLDLDTNPQRRESRTLNFE